MKEFYVWWIASSKLFGKVLRIPKQTRGLQCSDGVLLVKDKTIPRLVDIQNNNRAQVLQGIYKIPMLRSWSLLAQLSLDQPRGGSWVLSLIALPSLLPDSFQIYTSRRRWRALMELSNPFFDICIWGPWFELRILDVTFSSLSQVVPIKLKLYICDAHP